MSEGTRLGAQGAGRDAIIFETERTIGLMAAPLTAVVSLWPGRDGYADHSAAAHEGQPFRLFDDLQPVPHHLYLAHPLHFALAGRSTVDLKVDLTDVSAQPLSIAWEYWDGEMWRAFKAFGEGSEDGTDGLTHTGLVRLATDCGQTKPLEVDGVEGLWVRGRLDQPLPPTSPALPMIDRVRIRTVVDRSFPIGVTCADLLPTAGFQADQAFADAQKLDLTKSFHPLGTNPPVGSVFYVSSDEAFSKPGAQVTLCLKRSTPVQDQIDKETKDYEIDVNRAKDVHTAARAAAQRVVDLLAPLVDPNTGALRDDLLPSVFPADDPALPPGFSVGAWHTDAQTRIRTAYYSIVMAMPAVAANFTYLPTLWHRVYLAP